ncbi:glycosyltransferase family 2 protein [Aliarcobacter skirrowii]|uniref:glycosyltransferase family 2 protein n=1 Tax=Aliarcobacter skirrowii TaxID=28200 RepID=UPI0021B18460|nr:glycosyltransferase [Aliarcobacter skirrowii]MCT7447125.1 glycosyltransferase [Aliarcobacter skirrowii]
MKKKINISVVIPSLNGEIHLKDFLIKNLDIIKNTLESETSYKNIELIVVNDNSSDNTLSFIEDCKKNYSFLICKTNPKQGACSARNYGVTLNTIQNSDINNLNYILFIDNDVLLSEDFFKQAIKYLNTEPFCIACNGIAYYTGEIQDGAKLIKFKRGFLRFTSNIFNNKLNNNNSLNIPSFGAQGAYFFLKYSDFLELEGYDETMDPYLLEETDLVYRGLKRGKKSIYAKDVTGYHKVGGTIASKTSKRTKILSKRNRIYFAWKNLHSKTLFLQHLMFLPISIFTPFGLRGFIQALPMLKTAVKLNKKEREFIKINDKEILNQSKKFEMDILNRRIK